MATFYVKSGAGAADFQGAHTYSSGDKMVPLVSDASSNAATAKKWVWECTTGGLTVSTPTWSASVTQDTTTVTSGTATFTARKPGFSSGTTANWAYATIYLQYGCAACTTAGDTVYVSNNHNESQSAAYAFGSVGATSIICVSDSAAPPTALATTGAVTTTGNSTLSLGTSVGTYLYGLVLTSGSGASGGASITLAASTNYQTIEKCQLIIGTTGAGNISVGGTAINCDVKFSAAGQGITNSAGGCTIWTGGSLLAGGTSPTTLFVSTQSSYTLMTGFDLTNASAGINICAAANSTQIMILRDCRMPASWSGSINSGTPGFGAKFWLMNGDNTGTNYILNGKQQRGAITQDTSVYRTGGANNGVTALSWKFVATSAALFPGQWIEGPEIVKWFPITGFSVGNPVNVTIHFVHDSATGMTDQEIWPELVSLDTSGAPLGTLHSGASGVVTTASTWATDSGATWTGTGGFANPNKQSMTLTVTPQLAGIMHLLVKVAKASATVYVDPQLDFS